MKSLFNFIVEPKGERYNNAKEVEGGELILNTEIYNHQYVNREAVVKIAPIVNNTEIKAGDTVLVHHNVFRRWHNVKGIEKNSRSYYGENSYVISADQIFLYKRDAEWMPLAGFCFVKPIISIDMFNIENEAPLKGILKYAAKDTLRHDLNIGDIVGFRPSSEYEFVVDGERLYRVLSNFITIKYEREGHEEEYNPSWA